MQTSISNWPEPVFAAARFGRILVLRKPHGRVRTLVVGDVFRRLVAPRWRDTSPLFSSDFASSCFPCPFGLRTRASTAKGRTPPHGHGSGRPRDGAVRRRGRRWSAHTLTYRATPCWKVCKAPRAAGRTCYASLRPTPARKEARPQATKRTPTPLMAHVLADRPLFRICRTAF